MDSVQVIRKARRILIYGVPGSGKTTLARRLAERTGLPWHSVDDLTFDPGWVPVPDEEQRARIGEICMGKEWILDTAYGKWLDIPLARADVTVGLDYPRWFSLQRLVRRTLRRVVDQRPVCNGNRESLRTMFSRESIILWHFRSFARKRARLRQWAASENGTPVVLFRSSREVEDLLARI